VRQVQVRDAGVDPRSARSNRVSVAAQSSSQDRHGTLAKIHQLLEGSLASPTAWWIRLGIQALIVVNVGCVVAETVQPLGIRFAAFFQWVEGISIGLFTVEYLARLAASSADARYSHPLGGRGP
jgi:hypothetical protein